MTSSAGVTGLAGFFFTDIRDSFDNQFLPMADQHVIGGFFDLIDGAGPLRNEFAPGLFVGGFPELEKQGDDERDQNAVERDSDCESDEGQHRTNAVSLPRRFAAAASGMRSAMTTFFRSGTKRPRAAKASFTSSVRISVMKL